MKDISLLFRLLEGRYLRLFQWWGWWELIGKKSC
jgi:hypothetical protein